MSHLWANWQSRYHERVVFDGSNPSRCITFPVAYVRQLAERPDLKSGGWLGSSPPVGINNLHAPIGQLAESSDSSSECSRFESW